MKEDEDWTNYLDKGDILFIKYKRYGVINFKRIGVFIKQDEEFLYLSNNDNSDCLKIKKEFSELTIEKVGFIDLEKLF